MLAFHLATFKVDATPPLDHPLCGGWIKPVVGVDDPLWLRGVVILGGGLPIVLAALDWTGVLNESHRLWVEALADAARTTPDRVALHCVHQHNAPFVDRRGNELLQGKEGSSPIQFEPFVEDAVRRSAAEVREAINRSVPVTHVGYGDARVHEVASNRRVIGLDDRVKFVRTSATKDPASRAAPEGLIDPILRSVSFYREDRPLARLDYYTTHPMSYYGDGRVSADFVGLARARRDEQEPEALHLYFTGCAGNITAGKYNDGEPENRRVLTDRVHAAMIKAEAEADRKRVSLQALDWRSESFRFQAREDLDIDALLAVVADSKETHANRNRAAMACAWLERLESGRPILLSRLELPGVTLLHLPAETFVEYQLAAQAELGSTPLVTAAYGDGGPWYIPLRRSFDEGGYEPSVALVRRDSEPAYREAIARLLRHD